MKEEILMVGMSEEELGQKYVPGGREVKCTRCGKLIYLSPESLKVIKEKKAKPVCMECFDPKEVDSIEMSEGQKREFVDNLPVEELAM